MANIFVDLRETDPWGGLVHRLIGIFKNQENFNIVLIGPPGSGKRSAIKLAAHQCGLKPWPTELDSWNPGKIETAAQFLRQTQIFDRESRGTKPCVHLLLGLDLCQPNHDYSRAFNAIRRGRNVVAVCNDSTLIRQYYPDDSIIWSKGFSWNGMQEMIDKLPGSQVLSFEDKLGLCRAEGETNGNIRRLRLAAEMLIKAKQLNLAVDGTVDTMPHNYFDSTRLLNRRRLDTMPSGKVSVAWASANLISNLPLEQAHAASTLVAEVDTLDSKFSLQEEIILLFAKQTPVIQQVGFRDHHLAPPLTPIQPSRRFKDVKYGMAHDLVKARQRNSIMHAANGNVVADERPDEDSPNSTSTTLTSADISDLGANFNELKIKSERCITSWEGMPVQVAEGVHDLSTNEGMDLDLEVTHVDINRRTEALLKIEPTMTSKASEQLDTTMINEDDDEEDDEDDEGSSEERGAKNDGCFPGNQDVSMGGANVGQAR
jgi:hypothetical protein